MQTNRPDSDTRLRLLAAGRGHLHFILWPLNCQDIELRCLVLTGVVITRGTFPACHPTFAGSGPLHCTVSPAPALVED